MRHEYDLFERFQDGSSLWRASAWGLQSARQHLSRLAMYSSNEFYAINVVSGRVIFHSIAASEFALSPKIGGRSRAAAA